MCTCWHESRPAHGVTQSSRISNICTNGSYQYAVWDKGHRSSVSHQFTNHITNTSELLRTTTPYLYDNMFLRLTTHPTLTPFDNPSESRPPPLHCFPYLIDLVFRCGKDADAVHVGDPTETKPAPEVTVLNVHHHLHTQKPVSRRSLELIMVWFA